MRMSSTSTQELMRPARSVPFSIAALVLFGALSAVVLAAGQLSISRSVIGAGGGRSIGATLGARSTLGQGITGEAASTSLSIRSGFWPSQAETVTAVGPPQGSGIPVRHQLHQNTPNPFNPRTVIRYSLPMDTRAMLVIYDTRGRHVRTLVDGDQAAGTVEIIWDGKDDEGRVVASGSYIYQLRTPIFIQSRKMTLVR